MGRPPGRAEPRAGGLAAGGDRGGVVHRHRAAAADAPLGAGLDRAPRAGASPPSSKDLVATGHMSSRRRPPLWLAASAAASGSAAAYSVGLWTLLFAAGPIHEAVRMTYVAAQAGLRYVWPPLSAAATPPSLSPPSPP